MRRSVSLIGLVVAALARRGHASCTEHGTQGRPRNALMKTIFLRDLPDGTLLSEDRMTFDLPPGSHDVMVR